MILNLPPLPQFERQPGRLRGHVRAAAATAAGRRAADLHEPVGPLAGARHDAGAPRQRRQRHAGRLPPADAPATTGKLLSLHLHSKLDYFRKKTVLDTSNLGLISLFESSLLKL